RTRSDARQRPRSSGCRRSSGRQDGERRSPARVLLVVVPAAGIHEIVVGSATQALIGDGQCEGVADGVAVAQEVHGLAAITYAVGLQQLAPFVELAAGLRLDLSDVGYMSAGHGF